MIEEIVMPKFGWTMEEGTISQWHVAEGESVSAGQPIFTVETEKVHSDVEAEAGGVITTILAPTGAVVRVGEPVAQMEVGTPAVVGQREPPAAPITPPTPSPAAAAAPDIIELSSVHRRTGERMLESWRNAPQVTLTIDADGERIAALRESTEGHPSPTAIVAHLCLPILPQHPNVNARYQDGHLRRTSGVHLGFAMETERGLMAPVVRNAEALSLVDLGARMAELSEKGRTDTLRPEDVADGTFTVTGLGQVGIDVFTPILNPPQSAILGIGRLRREAVVRNEAVVPGWRIWLSLTFDHRALDGAPAGRFLQALASACRG